MKRRIKKFCVWRSKCQDNNYCFFVKTCERMPKMLENWIFCNWCHKSDIVANQFFTAFLVCERNMFQMLKSAFTYKSNVSQRIAINMVETKKRNRNCQLLTSPRVCIVATFLHIAIFSINCFQAIGLGKKNSFRLFI